MKRRAFIRTAAAAGTIAVAAAAGVLQPKRVLAARPDAAFLAKQADEALVAAFGTADAIDSGDIKVDAPLQAENGAVVPVKITTTLPNPELVGVIVRGNPVPLLTVLEATPRSGKFFSLRVKMAGTDKVVAYVKSDGKLYTASQEVRVAVGGCGG